MESITAIVNGHQCVISLTGRTLTLKAINVDKKGEPDEGWPLDCSGVYGVTQVPGSLTTINIMTWHPKRKGKPSVLEEHRVECSTLADVTALRAAVLQAAYPEGPRNLHVFINPVSGAGNAYKIWLEQALPVLRASIHRVVALLTTHAGHAEKLVREMALGPKDTLICVSGDGLLNEVVNGVVARPDFHPGMVQFATIPGGSGNGLAKTLGVENSVEAAIAIAKGNTVTLDCIRARQGTDVRCGFLGVGYAITADVDINSESMRWMGGARFTAYAVKKIISWSLPGYGVTMRYLPAKRQELTFFTQPNKCAVTQVCDAVSMPDIKAEPPESTEWVTVTDSLLFLNIMSIPYLGADFMSAPYAKLGDGCLDLVYLRRDGVSRLEIAKLMVAMEKGLHVHHPNVHYVKCHKVEFTPTTNPTHVVIDGEVLRKEKTEVDVLKGTLPFICAAWD